MHLEGDASGIGRPKGDDVGLTANALPALRELEHRLVRVDLGGAHDVVRGGVEVILDHRPRGVVVHVAPLRRPLGATS